MGRFSRRPSILILAGRTPENSDTIKLKKTIQCTKPKQWIRSPNLERVEQKANLLILRNLIYLSKIKYVDIIYIFQIYGLKIRICRNKQRVDDEY